jgi:hypothetical protein
VARLFSTENNFRGRSREESSQLRTTVAVLA